MNIPICSHMFVHWDMNLFVSGEFLGPKTEAHVNTFWIFYGFTGKWEISYTRVYEVKKNSL